MTTIQVQTAALSAVRDDALVLPVHPDEDVRRSVEACGRGFVGPYERLVERKVFAGKAGQVATLHGGARRGIGTLVVVGTGPAQGRDLEPLRMAVASGVRAARDAGAGSVSVVLPATASAGRRTADVAEAAAEAAVTGLYRFEAYKKEPAPLRLETVTLLAPRGGKAAAERGARVGRIVGEAVGLARDLGNEPSNTATPTFLADRARRLAEEEEHLDVRILEETHMKELGMGSLLGVAKGSCEPPKLIVLTYEPPRRGRHDTIALVGKGITFDTGGISIKPSAKLEDMKFDMCGGAAVIASLQAAARLEVPVRVVGLVPAAENMPGGAAYKPGDILRAMNGVTIEVKNTDAEGRLILADALAYASTKLRPRPKAIVDLATLTGACMVALGDVYAGLMAADERLGERLRAAGDASGDRLWPLPLGEAYTRKMDSVYADVSNLGPPGGGAITAGAFLQRFVGEVPWAHLDIAGMAWTERTNGFFTKGATGFGVRALARFLREAGRRGRR